MPNQPNEAEHPIDFIARFAKQEMLNDATLTTTQRGLISAGIDASIDLFWTVKRIEHNLGRIADALEEKNLCS